MRTQYTGVPGNGSQGFLLPDLCSAQAVLFLILIAVLLALTLVLFSSGFAGFDWVELGRAAVFILWTMLASAGLLCMLRHRIAHWPLAAGAGFAYLLILLVCAATNIAYQRVFSELSLAGDFRFDASTLARDLLICAMLAGAALRYFHLQGALLERQRLELNARIESLQARIRPHFLFNSMNIIASLIPVDPENAERAVEDLSELFRASLREGVSTVPLEDELELCERYLRLERLRLGDRLQYAWHKNLVGGGLRVPPLCIQPLLENAVYHGVQPLPEGGEIRISVAGSDEILTVEVTNPRPLSAATETSGSGIALANIRARLAAIYGERARLQTGAHAERFVARLELRRPKT
jgi:two-component system sensor histidine kinase AlgZ